MKSALIISGNLVQDHEFIYPYYRLLEEKFTVTVCLLGGQPVEGILGTKIPPNKDQKIVSPNEVDDVQEYSLGTNNHKNVSNCSLHRGAAFYSLLSGIQISYFLVRQISIVRHFLLWYSPSKFHT